MLAGLGGRELELSRLGRDAIDEYGLTRTLDDPDLSLLDLRDPGVDEGIDVENPT
jgi:hypothetical protein